MAQFSPRFKFSEPLDPNIPRVAAGVYAIWRGQALIYCGMASTSLKPRLRSHANGRLGGDQFCVYIANRLVIPALTPVQIQELASGSKTLDVHTRQFIQEHLEYAYTVTATSAEARALESSARRGEAFGAKPFLNPL